MTTANTPERFTEERSITGKTELSVTDMEARMDNLSRGTHTFRDMVTLDAKRKVGEECAFHLMLGTFDWVTQDVSVSSVQFNESGNIDVWWSARFACVPTRGNK